MSADCNCKKSGIRVIDHDDIGHEYIAAELSYVHRDGTLRVAVKSKESDGKPRDIAIFAPRSWKLAETFRVTA